MAHDIKSQLYSIIPPLSSDSHKGQAGRIGIFGGSKNYTGAPYFAAISALRTGCDLAHVFCSQDSSQVIKSYSPELIVHPILDSPDFSKQVSEHLPFLHSLIIGPGLGREETSFNSIQQLIDLAKVHNLPIVFDADALFYLNSAYNSVASYKKAILTPNKMEFRRLYESVTHETYNNLANEDVSKLSQLLGHVTIVKKGDVDVISDGTTTVICDEPGSSRRCGGQGDLLSGSMGVFSYWAHNYLKNTCNGENSFCNPSIIAALGACMLTRKCNSLAFQKYQRGCITTDMISEIHNAFSSLFSHV